MSDTRFHSPEPEVKLERSFVNPYKSIIAAARTCYSSKGVITDEEITHPYESLAKDLYKAGHHTTFQHAYFQFSLSNVSRQTIWSFLHSHPFYNSEQVSQRYVAVKAGAVAIPPLEGKALTLYQDTVEMQIDAYKKLRESLFPSTEAAYYAKFPARAKRGTKYEREIKKKALEVARYVLPIATFAYMYHTISAVTLFRYYRLCLQFDTPAEQRIIVQKMIAALIEFDPLYENVLQEPVELEATPEYEAFTHFNDKPENGSPAFIKEFDSGLDGRVSKLIDYKANNEAVLADSVREVLGLTRASLTDDDAIELALSPEKNRLLGESLNLTTHSKITRALFHPSYTFRKKMSHTGDSQDQRHRMTPASRPILAAHFSAEPDYVEPPLIHEDENSVRTYRETMDRTWEAVNKLKSLGVSDEFSLYLLPNAVSIRFTESADLLNLRHKHALRLCYNAQEEIWRASLDEAVQISEVNPRIGKYLLPPCSLRELAGARPICPEGKRYCGERVWTYSLSNYSRLI